MKDPLKNLADIDDLTTNVQTIVNEYSSIDTSDELDRDAEGDGENSGDAKTPEDESKTKKKRFAWQRDSAFGKQIRLGLELEPDDPRKEVFEQIVVHANDLVAELGVKPAVKKLEKILKLRTTLILQDPASYNSAYSEIWNRGMQFKSFDEVLYDSEGTPMLVVSCEFTWTHGIFKRVTKTEYAQRGWRFDVPITPDTDIDALFA